MSKKKADEKTVDAEIAADAKEEDDVLTTENDENSEPVEPEEEPKKKKATKDAVIMAVGKGVPNVSGPAVIMVNRAAIVFIAKQLMTPPDLEDFKNLYPSLFS